MSTGFAMGILIFHIWINRDPRVQAQFEIVSFWSFLFWFLQIFLQWRRQQIFWINVRILCGFEKSQFELRGDDCTCTVLPACTSQKFVHWLFNPILNCANCCILETKRTKKIQTKAGKTGDRVYRIVPSYVWWSNGPPWSNHGPIMARFCSRTCGSRLIRTWIILLSEKFKDEQKLRSCLKVFICPLNLKAGQFERILFCVSFSDLPGPNCTFIVLCSHDARNAKRLWCSFCPFPPDQNNKSFCHIWHFCTRHLTCRWSFSFVRVISQNFR